jgi:hypothetical protein
MGSAECARGAQLGILETVCIEHSAILQKRFLERFVLCQARWHSMYRQKGSTIDELVEDDVSVNLGLFDEAIPD